MIANQCSPWVRLKSSCELCQALLTTRSWTVSLKGTPFAPWTVLKNREGCQAKLPAIYYFSIWELWYESRLWVLSFSSSRSSFVCLLDAWNHIGVGCATTGDCEKHNSRYQSSDGGWSHFRWRGLLQALISFLLSQDNSLGHIICEKNCIEWLIICKYI